MKMSNISYGSGVTREVGYEMKALGAKRVMVVADPNLVNSDPVSLACTAHSFTNWQVNLTFTELATVKYADFDHGYHLLSWNQKSQPPKRLAR